MNEDIKKIYCDEGKEIVDMLFDAGIFNEKTTRDSMSAPENYFAGLFQDYARMAKRSADFTHKWKSLERGN